MLIDISESISDSENSNLSPPPSKKFRESSPEKEDFEEILSQPKLKRCNECAQVLDESLPEFNREDFTEKNQDIYQEFQLIENPKISIEGLEEQNYFLDQFVIYDSEGHLVHLDGISLSKEIKFSGIVTGFTGEKENGVAVLGKNP